jgi:hypothetical protein
MANTSRKIVRHTADNQQPTPVVEPPAVPVIETTVSPPLPEQPIAEVVAETPAPEPIPTITPANNLVPATVLVAATVNTSTPPPTPEVPEVVKPPESKVVVPEFTEEDLKQTAESLKKKEEPIVTEVKPEEPIKTPPIIKRSVKKEGLFPPIPLKFWERA